MKEDLFETLGDILNNKNFNEMFDIEAEQKELEEDGWTIEEARKFAQFLIKTQ